MKIQSETLDYVCDGQRNIEIDFDLFKINCHRILKGKQCHPYPRSGRTVAEESSGEATTVHTGSGVKTVFTEQAMDVQLFQRATGIADTLAARWCLYVEDAMTEFDITNAVRAAAFIAQIGHESSGFEHLVESFDYAPDALAIFRQIPQEQRRILGRQVSERSVPPGRQQQIANLAYAGRNGNTEPEDGWRYRGRGLIQITGLDNYRLTSGWLGVDYVADPDKLAHDADAARSAGAFWYHNGLSALADQGDIDSITRRINPAMMGKDARRTRWEIALRFLS